MAFLADFFRERVKMISTRIMKFEALMKLVDSGEIAAARELATSYVEAQPRGFMGYLCWTYVAFFGDRDLDVANGYLEETLRWDPRCEEAIHLGVLIWAGRDDAKEKYYIEQGMRYATREAFYPYRMGLLLEKQSLKEAAIYFEKAAVLGSRDAEYVGKYAVVMDKLGQKKVAREYLKRALGLDPNHVENVRRLAQLSYEVGDFKVARDLSEQALALAPNDSEAQRLVRQAYPTRNWLVALVRRIGLFFAMLFRGRMTTAKMNTSFVIGMIIVCLPLFLISNDVAKVTIVIVFIMLLASLVLSSIIVARRQLGAAVIAKPKPAQVIDKPVIIKDEPAKVKVEKAEPIVEVRNQEVNKPLSKVQATNKKISPKIIIIPFVILGFIGFWNMANDSSNDEFFSDSDDSYEEFGDGSEEISNFTAVQDSVSEDMYEPDDALVDPFFQEEFVELMEDSDLKEQFRAGITSDFFDDGERQYIKVVDDEDKLLFIAAFQDYMLQKIYGAGWDDTEVGKSDYQAIIGLFDEEFDTGNGILDKAHLKLIQSGVANENVETQRSLVETFLDSEFQDAFFAIVENTNVKERFVSSVDFVYMNDGDYHYIQMLDGGGEVTGIAQFDNDLLIYMYGDGWGQSIDDEERYMELLDAFNVQGEE
ncbi:hypothetical protein PWEIH_15513 [Listeria weihenstephanensis FSL R9-0317]|uniref:Uncharacterized protein n=2 Tax=Listeria weihenstephanensis TaxID=1006155 RepID=A0A1S7FRU0_9LIST|nr:hypothetical protein UE46_03330 [Listeria weihenstephanensis]EUJ35435.1 hypothetical protein PWEIH_15513 [Listeria weihenstephanensis FSL R9-0317]